MGKRPQLMIIGGEGSGRRYEVTANGVRLGRSSSNDIHVPDEELSRNHCFFEQIGEEGIRLTDLASANGTFVNGKPVGTDPVDLREGDVIEVGTTSLKVVGEEKSPALTSVDLGLGAVANAPDDRPAPAASVRFKRPRIMLIGALALLAVLAVSLTIMMPSGDETEVVKISTVAEDRGLKAFRYEKVSASDSGIFRYELQLTDAGELRVEVDDVPAQNRHLVKAQHLDEAARRELDDILSCDRLNGFDREYVGVMPDPPALESVRLMAVYGTCVREVRIVNVSEPEAFRTIREKLEAFSKNQLGVWALQYSREKLIELSEEAIRLAKSKWEDRDVRYGNLYESMSAYREAIFYLETVNPKPDCYAEAETGLKQTTAELETRYKEQRFLADRAINLAQWETAQRELLTLIELVPNRADPRNREASTKLVDVEKRLKGGAK